jgi:hypothetical protein
MRIYGITIVCTIALLIMNLLGPARAESEKIGPFNLTAHVYKVDVPFAANGTLDVNSSGGDFNAEAQVTLSSPTSQLDDNIAVISKALLPYNYTRAVCPIQFNKISDLHISYKDNEADISATVNLTVSHCLVLNGTGDVPVGIAITPNATNPGQLVGPSCVRRLWISRACGGPSGIMVAAPKKCSKIF